MLQFFSTDCELTTKLLVFLYVHSQGIQPEIMHDIAVLVKLWAGTTEDCNAKYCIVIFQYALLSSLPTAPFLLHLNTTNKKLNISLFSWYFVSL